MDLLLRLESSALVEWLVSTSWVYPWVISFHSIGMGFLVGVLLVIFLRVLGFGTFSIAPLERFLLIVRIAFAVSLVTGVILFLIDAQRFFFSPTFQLKMLLIVVGGVTGWVLTRMVFDGRVDTSESTLVDPGPPAKLIAGVSLVCWVGAIFAGRFTAYLP